MNSKHVAHAITGECVGDCNICGCSAESRANNTCCCAKKRRLSAQSSDAEKQPCCTSQKAQTPPPKTRSCCSTQQEQPVQTLTKSCCDTFSDRTEHDDTETPDSFTSKTETVLKCGGTCGKGKLFALTGLGSLELLPVRNTDGITLPYSGTLYHDITHGLVSLLAEPPTPPPKLSLAA
jgi:hypothetical protein